MLVQQPSILGELKPVQAKVCKGKRDIAIVFFELSCKGSSKRLSGGGTPADGEVVRQGYVSQYKTGSEDRWCVPEFVVLSGGCLDLQRLL